MIDYISLITGATALIWTMYQEMRCRTCPYYPPNTKKEEEKKINSYIG